MLHWKSAWSVCPQCRLRLSDAAAAATTRRTFSSRRTLTHPTTAARNPRTRDIHAIERRCFSTAKRWRNAQEARRDEEDADQEEAAYDVGSLRASPEEMARAARNFFGETLPQGALSSEEFVVYKRMYGEPAEITTDHLSQEADHDDANVVMRRNEDGSVDEFDVVKHDEDAQVVDEDADLDEEEEPDDLQQLQQQVDYLTLQQSASESALTFGETADETATEQQRSKDEILEDMYDNWPDDDVVRSHPLTQAGKFGTSPSTLQLPREAFVHPVQEMLSQVSNKHLSEAAQKALGGVGIPDSPSTPAIGRGKGQRPIPLTAMQAKMSPMDANVFVSSVMPQVYASCVSVLVECRKRMGKDWLRGLMRKSGGPLILDAGAGGAAIVAFREILRAEWESVQEEDGKTAGESRRKVPMGRATVVTGSDSLRLKAASLLENTTFIPRMPDYVDPTETETNAQQPRKRYDVIIASHALWTLVEEHERKTRVQNLWSLLNPNGGLLIIIEKGIPRGFEVVASARDLLLSKHISSPDNEAYENTLEERGTTKDPKKERYTVKEKGSIIAPCTNHTRCPLYPVPGVSRGRKDWCYFQQRYIRPSYLMSVLQAKARNHDDVDFSYLAVQRGVDIRQEDNDTLQGTGAMQGVEATEKAREGYGPKRMRRSDETHENDDVDEAAEEVWEDSQNTDTEQPLPQPHPLSLPRIMPAPLKRKGHILLDVCTPSGTYERWMVRKAMGRQVFRDGRKAKWGDLWAMGAAVSEARRTKLGTPLEVVRLETKRARERVKGFRKGRDKGKGKWAFGSEEARGESS